MVSRRKVVVGGGGLALLGSSVYLISNDDSSSQRDSTSSGNTSTGEEDGSEDTNETDIGEDTTVGNDDSDTGRSSDITISVKELENEEYDISETLVVHSTVTNAGNASGSYEYEITLDWKYGRSETSVNNGTLQPDSSTSVESEFYLGLSGDVEVLLDGNVVDTFHVDSGASSSSSSSDESSAMSSATGESNTEVSGNSSV